MTEAEMLARKQMMREKFEAQLEAMAAAARQFVDHPDAVGFRDFEFNLDATLGRVGDEIAASIFEQAAAAIRDRSVGESKKNSGSTNTGKPRPSSCSTENPRK